MRIVFMGSPAFALPALRRLIGAGHDIAAVYTQPDRPAGRGRRLMAPPVKVLAMEHGLEVRQPSSISKPEAVAQLGALRAEAGIIAAYGQILKQPVLDAFPSGVLNIHASLLPRWRGAAPVVAAILAGDGWSGATIMLVRLALDAGPTLAAARVRIEGDDTAATLADKIAEAGADLLVEMLPRWQAGEIEPREQDESLATYAPRVEKADALIRWERDGIERIARHVRAYNPWPMAYSYLDGAPLRIVEAAPMPGRAAGEPGLISAFASADAAPANAGFAVSAADGALAVITVQPAGGRAMPAGDFVRGQRGIIGKRLAGA